MLCLHLSQRLNDGFKPVLTCSNRHSFLLRSKRGTSLCRPLFLSWPLQYSVQQYLAVFFFFFVLGLVIGSGSGSVFIRRSRLALLHHGLLDLPALLLFRLEQLLALIQMVKEWADGRGARLSYPCSKLNYEVGDDPCPIHLSPSVQRSKGRVIHSNNYPVWLFRIQNWNKKCEHPSVMRIHAVLDRVPSLGLGSSLK
jgi:hypothetical protein